MAPANLVVLLVGSPSSGKRRPVQPTVGMPGAIFQKNFLTFPPCQEGGPKVERLFRKRHQIPIIANAYHPPLLPALGIFILKIAESPGRYPAKAQVIFVGSNRRPNSVPDAQDMIHRHPYRKGLKP